MKRQKTHRRILPSLSLYHLNKRTRKYYMAPLFNSVTEEYIGLNSLKQMKMSLRNRALKSPGDVFCVWSLNAHCHCSPLRHAVFCLYGCVCILFAFTVCSNSCMFRIYLYLSILIGFMAEHTSVLSMFSAFVLRVVFFALVCRFCGS